MSSPALRAHLDPAGKVLDDPPAFLLWDRSCCCCDCCLQVRDSLVVVAIHPVIKVYPNIKIWEIQEKSGECGDHCGSHLRLISRSGKRCCIHANDSFEVWGWGVAPSCWNHWRTLKTPLRRPSADQNSPHGLPVDFKLLALPTRRLAWAVDNRVYRVFDSSNVVWCP